jgi:importin subunit beta-1
LSSHIEVHADVQVSVAGHGAAMAIAKIARIDLLDGSWPDLLDKVDQCVKPTSSDITREHALECLGFICEEHVDVSDKFPQQETNRMLTSLVQGMADKEHSNVCLAATRALCDALEFAFVNFEHNEERTYLMQMICEVTINHDPRIRLAAYQNLNKVLELHYRYLEPYIATIYGLTTKTFQDGDDEVAMQVRMSEL